MSDTENKTVEEHVEEHPEEETKNPEEETEKKEESSESEEEIEENPKTLGGWFKKGWSTVKKGSKQLSKQIAESEVFFVRPFLSALEQGSQGLQTCFVSFIGPHLSFSSSARRPRRDSTRSRSPSSVRRLLRRLRSSSRPSSLRRSLRVPRRLVLLSRKALRSWEPPSRPRLRSSSRPSSLRRSLRVPRRLVSRSRLV